MSRSEYKAQLVCDFSPSQALFKAQWSMWFSNIHPYCLPIGNHPLILWVLEAMSKMGVKTLKLVDPYQLKSPCLHRQFKRLVHKWNLLYGMTIEWNTSLTNEEGDMNLQGVQIYAFDQSVQQLISQNLQHVGDYYHENMRGGSYWSRYVTLPYLENSKKMRAGAHHKQHASSQCTHTLLGKSVRLAPHSQVAGSVIGDDCRVGNHTHLFGSLVLPGTCLGSHLEIVTRIVTGSYLIDPFSGEWVLTDPLWSRKRQRFFGG